MPDSSILKVNPIFPEVYPDYYPERLEDTTTDEKKRDVGFIEGVAHSAIATMLKERAVSLKSSPPEKNPILGDASIATPEVDSEEDSTSGYLSLYIPGKVPDAPESTVPETPKSNVPEWIPSDEEILMIARACNWNDEAVDHILREANSSADIQPLLAIYKENRDYHNAEAKAGAVDSLLSGFGKSLGNPVDLATIGLGAASTIPKAIAIGAGLSAGSTFMEEYSSGIEEDITGASIAGGALLGGVAALVPFAKGFSRLGDTAIESAHKSDVINNALYNTGANIGKIVHDSTPVGVRSWLGEQKQRFYDSLTTLSLEGARDLVMLTEKGRGVLDNIFFSQKGRSVADANIKVQAPRDKLLVEDLINKDSTEVRLVQDKVQIPCRQLKANGLTYEGFQDAFYSALEGKLAKDSPYMKLEGFQDAVTAGRNYISKRRTELLGAGVSVGDFGKPYVPLFFDYNKLTNFMEKVWGKLPYEQLRKKMIIYTKNLLMKSADDPATRQRLIEFWKKETKQSADSSTDMQAFSAWLNVKATKDATGYVDQARSLLDERGADRVFTPEYSHERTPWDLSIKDANGISMNSFRVDPLQAIAAYGRKTTGDIAAMKIFGVKPQKVASGADGSMLSIKGSLRQQFNEVVQEEIKAVNPTQVESHKKAVQRAMDSAMRAIYRTAESDYDINSSWGSAIADTLRNLAFMASNGYMGLLNLTEQAEGIKAYGATFMIRSLPVVSKMFSSWSKGQMTNRERRELLNVVFGYDVRGLRIWDETKQRTAFKYGENSLKTKLVAGSAQLAEWMPTTRFLNATQESISKTAQDMFLGELLHYTYKGKGGKALKKGFLSDETLLRAGVSKEDFKAIQEALTKAFVPNEKRYFDVRDINALLDNQKALFALRRLGNYVSSECIQKNTLANTMLWQGSKSSPIMNMLFQFKTFALASFNNRLVKSWNRYKEGDVIGQAQTHVLSLALAGMGLMAQTTLKTAGMSEEERKKWMKRNYGIESIDEANPDTLMKFLVNAAFRSGMLASVALPISMIYNPQVKSTTSSWSPRDKPTVQEGIADLFPSARVANSILGIGYDAFMYATSPEEGSIDSDLNSLQIRRQKERHAKAFARDLLNLTPHIDVLRNIIKSSVYDAIENN